MSETRHVLRIFVAGAADVSAEVSAVRTVAEELNRGVAADKGVVLEVLWWRTHVAPAMGEPEKTILRQMWPEDIFVGILFGRFGTPTAHADSGTEEEFQLAYRLWAASGGELGGRPRILMYFRQASQHIRTPDEAAQKAKVLQFRERIKSLGLLWDYRHPAEFERFLREHLTRILREWPDEGTTSIEETSIDQLSKRLRRGRSAPSQIAVVFTDIVGFTRLNLLLGRRSCDELRNEYNVGIYRLVAEHGGFLIRAHGDEVLAVFPGVGQAVNCAGKVSGVADDLSARAGHAVAVRVGINAPTINLRNIDAFWLEAKRAGAIAKLAPDGRVYATPTVADACRKGRPMKGVLWYDHGSSIYGRFRFDSLLEILYPGQRTARAPRKASPVRDMVIPGGIFGFAS